MSHDKFMEKLNKADKLLRHFPHGIRAVDFAEKLGIHRTQVYIYLNSLDVRGKAYSEHGLWFPKEGKRPSKQLEIQTEMIRAAAKIRVAEIEALGKTERT